MPVRTVKLELEAKLTSETGGLFSKPSGKLERKSYGDLRERLKISVRNLRVRDHSIAVVMADGLEIAEIPIRKGVGRFDREARSSGSFPKLEAGQTIEVYISGALVLSGELRID